METDRLRFEEQERQIYTRKLKMRQDLMNQDYYSREQMRSQRQQQKQKD